MTSRATAHSKFPPFYLLRKHHRSSQVIYFAVGAQLAPTAISFSLKEQIVFASRILELVRQRKFDIVSGAASPRSAFVAPDAPRRRPPPRRRGKFELFQA